MGSYYSMGTVSQFWQMKNILEVDGDMLAKQCKST